MVQLSRNKSFVLIRGFRGFRGFRGSFFSRYKSDPRKTQNTRINAERPAVRLAFHLHLPGQTLNSVTNYS